MKSIHVTNRSRAIKELLKQAKDDDLLVRTPDGDEYMLTLVDDFDREIAQQRRNKTLMAFLDKRFRAARTKKGIPLDEVQKQLGIKR